MKIDIQPGKYVVAVSGGVDSVVLLNLLSNVSGLELVVAHYDHGIREDSGSDKAFVEGLAALRGLPFFSAVGKLGPKTSEALAREKRYEFLWQVKEQTAADAIITAHHRDDFIETAIINMQRGTGRRGLSALGSTAELKRPLLGFSKAQLIDYAKAYQLTWHEDATNQDKTYLRNYVRHEIVPKFSRVEQEAFVALLQQTGALNAQIDGVLKELLAVHTTATSLERQWFTGLPHEVAREVLLAWLRQTDIRHLDRKQVERIVVLAKTLPHGKLIDVDSRFQLKITTNKLALIPRER
jgi:tRNA(Ile)-lysidine synthetase-like protein